MSAGTVRSSAVVPDPTLRLELNFGTGPTAPDALVLDAGRLDVNALEIGPGATWLVLDDATAGQLDQERLAADALGSGFWTDVAEWCDRVSIRTGRTRALESFNAGRLTATLDNADRRFDPTNTDGPYVSGGNSAIEPMRPVRVIANHSGIDYPLIFAYADGWPVEWQHAMSTTTLSATDAFKVLADFDPLAVAAVGAGEDSGARIDRILDNAGWSTTARDVETGNSALQATTLASNALGEMRLVADTERGQLYVAPDGRVTFRRRRARQEDARSVTVQATFGDGVGSDTLITEVGDTLITETGDTLITEAGNEVPYADLRVAYDDELLRNVAYVARVGGTAQTSQDATSIARYQRHTYTRTDLIMTTDAEAADHGAAVVQQFKDNELRFDTLVLEPVDDEWTTALALRIGDRITIRKRPPPSGLIERQCFVEGIDHDVSPRQRWRVTVALSDASSSRALVLDSPTLGVLDDPAVVLAY